MQLTVITNPYAIKSETEIINRLLGEGPDELHIRKPDMNGDDMTKFISRIDSGYHHKLVLYSHYSLVNTFDIHRIHLAHDRAINFFTDLYLDRAVLKGKKVSKSITITNCNILYKPIPGIHQFLLGPVFEKFSYFVDKQLIPTDELEKALRQSKVPITALGGVRSDNLEFFKNAGFNGVAMQSYIWKSSDPIGSFIEIRDHNTAAENKLRIAV